MAYYRTYKLSLSLRIAVIFLLLIALTFVINTLDFKADTLASSITIAPIVLVVIFALRNLFKFTTKRHKEIYNFFEFVKYRDFSQWFNEASGSKDIRELRKGFNEVNQTIRDIKKEKETQYIYLQKILELIDTGIVAYSIETGKVLWINDSFKKILHVPTLKSIHFVKKRNQKIYKDVFETNYANGSTISINTEKDKTKILISSSHFEIDKDAFKLIVLQNIDNTLNQNQSEAWTKLLRVMTHEIMNSVAPISSLAETLQSKIKLSLKDSDRNPLDIDDLYLGIKSIKKRSGNYKGEDWK